MGRHGINNIGLNPHFRKLDLDKCNSNVTNEVRGSLSSVYEFGLLTSGTHFVFRVMELVIIISGRGVHCGWVDTGTTLRHLWKRWIMAKLVFNYVTVTKREVLCSQNPLQV